MKDMVNGAATAAAISISGLVGSAARTQAYQVDHAILLSLAAASASAQAEVRLVLDAYQEMFQ
jgi:hypothetical protein